MSVAVAERPSLVVVPGGAPDGADAGTLTIPSVADKTYDADELRRAWEREGLDMTLLPKPRNPVHDFQNACRSVATSRRRSSDREAEVKVDEVDNQGERCVYVITRMTRDRANLLLNHENEMRISFNKLLSQESARDPIKVETVGHGFSPELAQEIELRIREHYTANKGRLPGASIRAILRDVFKATHSIDWSKGKAYFTPIEHKATLKAVERALRTVCGDNADFDIFPCANGEELRKKIDKHGTRTVVNEATKLVVEIAERLNGDKPVTQKARDAVLAERAYLEQMRQRVQDLIGKETNAIDWQLRLLDDQIDVLEERVKEPKA